MLLAILNLSSSGISQGQRSDVTYAIPVLEYIDLTGSDVLADRGYDCWKLIDHIYEKGGEPSIPSKKGAKFERRCEEESCVNIYLATKNILLSKTAFTLKMNETKAHPLRILPNFCARRTMPQIMTFQYQHKPVLPFSLRHPQCANCCANHFPCPCKSSQKLHGPYSQTHKESEPRSPAGNRPDVLIIPESFPSENFPVPRKSNSPQKHGNLCRFYTAFWR